MSGFHVEAFMSALADLLHQERIQSQIEELTQALIALRDRGGRLFCIGVGGGAANAAHAVCDFRKLCGIEAYAPSDGIAELTARTNDDGWQHVFWTWLKTSRLNSSDAVMVFSVGGGAKHASACISEAVEYARVTKAPILGIVGLAQGATARYGDAVVVTEVSGPLLTPLTEAAQGVILHALVSDRRLQVQKTKW